MSDNTRVEIEAHHLISEWLRISNFAVGDLRVGRNEETPDVITHIEKLQAESKSYLATQAQAPAVPDGPTEQQVYRWFQIATITHPIQQDGSHIKERANYVAQQAWKAAQSAAVPEDYVRILKELAQMHKWYGSQDDASYGKKARMHIMELFVDQENDCDRDPIVDLKNGSTQATPSIHVDDLAQFIRQIDGNHSMGAGTLAEHIVEYLTSHKQLQLQEL